jgi:hypothetical protein
MMKLKWSATDRRRFASAQTSTDRRAPLTRLIAGVSVPDGPLITAAIEYAQRLSKPYLFNHAMRSWLFAELIGRTTAIDYDREVVAVGTILHDIGLTAGVSGPNRFEVNGADAALSFITGRGLSDRRAQLVWDLVALNSTPSLALHKEPEVAVGTMGIGLDYGGFGVDARLSLRSLQAKNPWPITPAAPRAHHTTRSLGSRTTSTRRVGGGMVRMSMIGCPPNRNWCTTIGVHDDLPLQTLKNPVRDRRPNNIGSPSGWGEHDQMGLPQSPASSPLTIKSRAPRCSPPSR